MPKPVVEIKNVHKSYPAGTGKLDVLRGVSFEVRPGEIVAITGASGTGKSTLLHIAGGLDTPNEGEVRIAGEDVFRMPDARLAAFRNRTIGFVFQFHHLLAEFTALENVAMPLLIAGCNRNTAARRARALLQRVRVEHRADARPSELSGGEQQRVAVARALANDPAVVLADEPSGNLDEENAAALHDLLWSLARENEQTFVLVTHDESLARHADTVYRLHEGRLHPGRK
ncbi:MAG: ABC transporter ATP-binding protein [Bacteroidota bacterium]|nr:ABC transporter ATP-binding protein [Bacteroidota bacterium]